MEISDIKKLRQEVFDHGPEASLPSNLSDEWVLLLARDLDMVLSETGKRDEDHRYLTAPLAIIAHILLAKRGGLKRRASFTGEEFFEYLEALRFEIALEEIRRWTDICPEPATLETIFTNRIVKM